VAAHGVEYHEAREQLGLGVTRREQRTAGREVPPVPGSNAVPTSTAPQPAAPSAPPPDAPARRKPFEFELW
jgi:hypothetical protein